MRAIEPLLRRQHTLELHKEVGRYPESQVLVLAAKDSPVPLNKSSTSLLDLRFLELGDLCSYPGSVNNCLMLT